MNRSTSKMLSKYALHSEQKIKDLKKWWNSLSWQERTEERKRIISELGKEAAEPAETEAG